MELYSIYAEDFKLDGGACYGVVPKNIWQKFVPADENNLINICLRSLLIKEENRLILIDTGIGTKQGEKFLSHYDLFGDNSLEKSFSQTPYTYDDVTDVIFTHLHFDHCGGAVIINKINRLPEPRFKNALYHVSKKQWDLAYNPNKREKASFFNENTDVLREKGLVRFVNNEEYFTPHIYLKIVNGHTLGQLIPIINYGNRILVYTADFIPSLANIAIPYIASYDTQPLVSMEEKEIFLEEAVKNNYILFFEHDYYNECCTVKKDEKGRFKEDAVFKLSDLTVNS